MQKEQGYEVKSCAAQVQLKGKQPPALKAGIGIERSRPSQDSITAWKKWFKTVSPAPGATAELGAMKHWLSTAAGGFGSKGKGKAKE
jgi:hypothetical protein